MELNNRVPAYIIPRYSLTGDVLSYQRCGLQYRYYNGSSLPPSRPVQFWTGEFVHGCLEDAFSIWLTHKNDPKYQFPWPIHITEFPKPDSVNNRLDNDIGVIGDRVEARLSATQKAPRSAVARQAAYDRVNAAINILAPHLFPLITSVEQKISGSRNLISPVERTDKYELFGIADVISHIEYQDNPNNRIVSMLAEAIPGLSGSFDIIVDYKAARRPNMNEKLRNHHEWQVQTYSWLRSQIANNTPIKAGIVVYINELFPTKSDLREMKRELQKGICDVAPETGGADYYALNRWDEHSDLPALSNDFLLRRALRFISASSVERNSAVQHIDEVVQEIESCVQLEYNSGHILSSWNPKYNKADCAACDFRRFCSQEGKDSWSVQAPG